VAIELPFNSFRGNKGVIQIHFSLFIVRLMFFHTSLEKLQLGFGQIFAAIPFLEGCFVLTFAVHTISYPILPRRNRSIMRQQPWPKAILFTHFSLYLTQIFSFIQVKPSEHRPMTPPIFRSNCLPLRHCGQLDMDLRQWNRVLGEEITTGECVQRVLMTSLRRAVWSLKATGGSRTNYIYVMEMNSAAPPESEAQ